MSDAVRRRGQLPTVGGRQSSWLQQIIRPHRLSIDVANGIGLTRSCPSGWPQIGRGQAVVTGGPRGHEVNACAISTACQLIANLCNRTIPNLGGLAHEVRTWIRVGAGDLIPIADAWWLVAARAFGTRQQPRLLMLDTQGRTVRDSDITVAIGPGAWNGEYVFAVGTGRHFDPIWWRHDGALRATTTSRVSQHYANRISLQTDAGPAAAFLIGVGATTRARSGLHPAAWPDALDAGTVTAWAQQIDAVLLAQGSDVAASTNGWQDRCIIFLCLTPDPATLLADVRNTPPLYQLIDAAHDPRGPSQADISWILAADPDHLYLAQASQDEDYQNMLRAAIGRGNP